MKAVDNQQQLNITVISRMISLLYTVSQYFGKGAQLLQRSAAFCSILSFSRRIAWAILAFSFVASIGAPSIFAQESAYRSLRTDRAYMRTAPGLDKPVRWVYRQRGLPLLSLNEVDRWWHVRDWQGEEGWVHSSQLSSLRTAIVVADEVSLLSEPSDDASEVAILRYQVVVELRGCGIEWCEGGVRLPDGGQVGGWVRRVGLWGIQAGEIIE
ncbi:MAG: hypothetical protein K0U36_03945 [Alphaproteobacteria bacterium]|nr:hypothetical protein [Alphaproteobacteria bacterium]